MKLEVPDKRDKQRLRPRRMLCNLGQVLDLSPGGMRLVARRQLRNTVTVVITGVQRQPVRLTARVMWHRRVAAGEHVHGLRFERVTLEQREELYQLVQLLNDGEPIPKPRGLSRYGVGGMLMLLTSLAFVIGWYTWTQHNPALLNAAPAIHNALAKVPELDAVLIVLAGGCSLLAIHQRHMPGYGIDQGVVRHGRSSKQTSQKTDAQQQSELDQMLRSQNVLNCILESSLGGVCVVETIRVENDQIGGFQIQLVNPAAEQLIGKKADMMIGRTLEETLPGLVGHELYRDLLTLVQGGEPVQKDYQLGADGRWYLVAMVRLSDGIAITFLDNTEAREQSEKLQHIAYHDELTGLPNRKALIEHVDSSLTRTRRASGHRSALLFLDFDRFKQVNDTLGHDAGDQLLIGIADRLRDNLRQSDAVGVGTGGQHIPARLGGDEFVVLLDGIGGPGDAVAVASRLLKVFAQPYTIAGQRVVSTASIGIAVNEGAYQSADEILRDADAAMYTAKQTGKGRYVLFDNDMQQQILQRLHMEQDLRQAVERDELHLVYEPIIDLQSGRTAGFEALVRWHHPTRGEVPPDQFIPLAEDLNLIGGIGEWVIQQACAQLGQWCERGAELFLNINLSRGQLYEPGLVELFREQIRTHHLDPAWLRLELTETMVMNDLLFMAERLSELKALGIGLALDDFGTGYSSLSVLHKLPFDTLKIDRAFLDEQRAAGREQTRRSSAIISAITELAEQLKLDVIAEGIAEPAQVATLQALACRYAQGWYFSKPLNADDAYAALTDPTPHTGIVADQLSMPA